MNICTTLDINLFQIDLLFHLAIHILYEKSSRTKLMPKTATIFNKLHKRADISRLEN